MVVVHTVDMHHQQPLQHILIFNTGAQCMTQARPQTTIRPQPQSEHLLFTPFSLTLVFKLKSIEKNILRSSLVQVWVMVNITGRFIWSCGPGRLRSAPGRPA